MAQQHSEHEDDEIRAEFDEYVVDGTQVGLVIDPENEDAWIESDLTMDVDS